jgi:hypothetical protein
VAPERSEAQRQAVQERSDWTRGLRGVLAWCVPIVLLLLAPHFGERYLVIVWPIVLAVMGVACLLNARSCGRVHCYATGPFFLLLAVLALLHGVGVVPLGRHGWSRLWLILIAGSVLLGCGPELLFGRYRRARSEATCRDPRWWPRRPDARL